MFRKTHTLVVNIDLSRLCAIYMYISITCSLFVSPSASVSVSCLSDYKLVCGLGSCAFCPFNFAASVVLCVSAWQSCCLSESRSLAFKSSFSAASPEACPDEKFLCENGDCIPASWQCDGINDCDSDEVNCEGELAKISECF